MTNQSLRTSFITLEDNGEYGINYLVKKLVLDGIMPKLLLIEVMNGRRKTIGMCYINVYCCKSKFFV